VALSPRLSLRRTKTPSQEPTVAKSSDWRCSEEGRIYEENRRWARGEFPFSKPPPSASRPPHRGGKLERFLLVRSTAAVVPLSPEVSWHPIRWICGSAWPRRGMGARTPTPSPP